jgi:pilus assembly protein CpaB
MITMRTTLLLGSSIALSAVAAFIANSWIQNELNQGGQLTTSMEHVVVASMKIPYGLEIGDTHIKVKEVPKGTAPAGAFSDAELVVGAVSRTDIFPGEVIIKDRVVAHGGGNTLAAMISPNKRAITVRVNDVVGVAGFLLPGNRVDIISTKKKGKKIVSETILRNIKVLAVDQTASTDKNEPIVVRSVTMEMSPGETEDVTVATKQGSLQLTLRNPTQDKVAKSEEVIVKPKPKKVVKRVVKKKRVSQYGNITIIRGTATEVQKTKL